MISFNVTGASVSEDIVNCIVNICSIPSGTVPMMRELGTDWSILSDVPIEIENDYATELIEKIERFESRVRVSEISFLHYIGDTTINIVLESVEDSE